MKELCEDFNKTISFDLSEFIENIWFSSSWKTFSRTIKKESSQKLNDLEYQRQRKELKKIIFIKLNSFPFLDSFDNESYKKFKDFNDNQKQVCIDDWYKNTINSEYEFFNYLTIGQKQKLINILIKYSVCCSTINLDSKNKFKYRFEENLKFLHIPIDNVILKNTNYLFSDEDEILKNVLTSKHCFKLVRGESSWSKLNNYESYIKFQKYIRDKSNMFGMSPLEFEMKFLWKSEKDLIQYYFYNN